MPAATVSVKVKGLKAVSGSIRLFTKRMKNFPNKGAEILAKDVQRGARMRYTQRGFKRSTGRAYHALIARPIKSGGRMGAWGINFDPRDPRTGAFYGPRLEMGLSIPGWDFLPRTGKGRAGIGYSVLPEVKERITGHSKGVIPITKRGFFLRDAFESTNKRARQILSRRLNNEIRRSGFK